MISLILMIIGMVVVTWGARIAPVLMPRLTLPPSALRILNCVPAAVLSALIAEPILNPVASNGSFLQPSVLAAVLCLIMGLIGIPMLLTVIIGMASFWLLGMWV
ncbi:AzlD domain-containing protein [Reinekea forsetii]|nr:AzlD domain-containing protein [Reinekea forsetii]